MKIIIKTESDNWVNSSVIIEIYDSTGEVIFNQCQGAVRNAAFTRADFSEDKYTCSEYEITAGFFRKKALTIKRDNTQILKL